MISILRAIYTFLTSKLGAVVSYFAGIFTLKATGVVVYWSAFIVLSVSLLFVIESSVSSIPSLVPPSFGSFFLLLPSNLSVCVTAIIVSRMGIMAYKIKLHGLARMTRRV